MNPTQIDLNFRVTSGFGPGQLHDLLRLAHDCMVFDEDTRYELIIQKNNGERVNLELALPELGGYIHVGAWAGIHQVIISNQWIKGMNLKLTLVRRQEYHTVSLKGELETAEACGAFTKKIRAHLAGIQVDENGGATADQERERLFGSMLMTETIVRATRKSFLAGQFGESLNAASVLLRDRLSQLLGGTVKKPVDIIQRLAEEPPRLLFPDLAGNRLQLELAGLGNLCAGVLMLMQPVVSGREAAPEDPARVLRCLVLFGMLLERLEVATPNPAAKRKRPAKAKPGPARTKKTSPAASRVKTRIANKKRPVKSRGSKSTKKSKRK